MSARARGLARWRVPLGFVAGALYLWLARPTPATLAWGLPVAAAGLGMRAWAAGYIRKNDALAQDGPYAYTRNPLYLGSTLLASGLVIAGGEWILAAVALAMLVGVYLPVIRSEEAFLRDRFGAEFDAYAARVPRLLPRWGRGGGGGGAAFSAALYRRHREYNALVGFLLVAGILGLKLRWPGAWTLP